MELNGKQQPLRTRFKVRAVERLDRDLTSSDFVPALDTQERALLNQNVFGYAYLRSEVPVNRTVPSTLTDQGKPMNQIFYGPPGTGKTFHLQALFAKYTDHEGEVDRASWTQKLLGEVGWRPVIAAALAALGGTARAPEIRDHALVAQKAQLNGRSPKHMLQTIWGFLQEHTSRECLLVQSAIRREPFLFHKSEDGRWSLVSNWEQMDPESAELVKQLNQGPTADAEPAKRYRVVTFHPSFGYEDFIRGIRPTVDSDTGAAHFAMVDGVFKQICDQARANPSKRYALFIDEINRANIAKVFGELITLIEIDKRAEYDAAGLLVGGMEVQLPGSADDGDVRGFGVPVNLDIYGTMNTADRSIALLDIALRRRFEFIERAPDYAVIEHSIEGVHLGRLLRRINDRLEYLLDRDHRIGHAYFIHLNSLEDLRSCFAQKILPLLQEYFFDDASRVAMVLSTPAKPGFLLAETQSPEALFTTATELGRLQARTRYVVTPQSSWASAMFRGIYENETALPDEVDSEDDEPETFSE
jgi:5-methylcytosine-specific restriction protein B